MVTSNIGKDTKTVGTVKFIVGKSSTMGTNGTVVAKNLSIGAVIQELKGRKRGFLGDCRKGSIT